MKTLISIISLLVTVNVFATNWYVSPTASTNGLGTINSPWTLRVALKATTNVLAGDTILLRGGEYHGPFVSTISGELTNYITVKSYPNEWAILTDMEPVVLAESIANNSSTALLIGSEAWFGNFPSVIVIDGEHIYLDYNAPPVWNLVRGWGGTTATPHSSNTLVTATTDAFLNHNGSYVKFMDFEIKSYLTTNRVVGASNWIGAGINFSKIGSGNKAINLVIRNVGHPGIGFWEQGEGGEVNGCIVAGVGVYDNNGAWLRGQGLYAQNDTNGMIFIKNSIWFRNLTGGPELFGETGPVINSTFSSNIAFDNNSFYQIAVISGSTTMSNNWIRDNTILGGMALIYESTGNSHQYVFDNIIVNGGLQPQKHTDSVYTNNTILNMRNVEVAGLTYAENGFRYPTVSSNDLNIVWDYNTWYIGDGASLNAWNFSSLEGASGWLYWPQWQALSGFDAHSTVATNWPTDYLTIRVQPYDYDTNRWNIAVVSTSGQTNATVNLSDYGFSNGQGYSLVDVQNWPIAISSGTYQGGTINLPLNLTNVVMISGVSSNYLHSNVDNMGLFNVFVLTRQSPKSIQNLKINNARF